MVLGWQAGQVEVIKPQLFLDRENLAGNHPAADDKQPIGNLRLLSLCHRPGTRCPGYRCFMVQHRKRAAMKPYRIVTLLVVVSAFTLAGCANTVRGMGKDVNNTADAIEDSVN